jgi:TolB-like protein/DNA-binding winged helix-turn-helix (wHTH) protein
MGALGRGGTFLFEGFRLDRNAGALFRRDDVGAFVPMAVGSRALEVLDVLVERAGDLVSRDEFMTAVWPTTVVEDTNLNMQIAALRRVLDEGRGDGSCIHTIPGRGYRLAVPVTRVEPSGQRSGNGAGGPVALQPEPENPAPPSRSRNTPPKALPRERKWLWCGGLALVAGALCLLAVAITVPNWHLPQSGETHPAPRLSIVVLPFADLNDDHNQGQLANSITEELITDLSLLPDIRVTSRNTAFTYGNRFVDTKQIGRELDVRYVLEGSVQRSASQVRVNAQLIDAETDANLWAERFEGDMGKLFALQDDITRRMAIALDLELTNRAARRLTEHSDALDYILRGRAVMNKPFSRDNFAEAVILFERALELDPGSVEARARLAIALVGRVLNAMTASPAADIARAEDLIGQALAASPLDPRAHFAKGILLRRKGRPEEAAFEFEAALAQNRNWVGALFQLGWCKLMTGSIDEVIPAAQQLIHLGPHDPNLAALYQRVGWGHLMQSHIDEAIPWLEKSRSVNPVFSDAHFLLASAYALRGDAERGAAELAEARRLRGGSSFSSIAQLARGYWGVPKTRALVEATVFAGLRKAGVPEE